MSPQDLKIGLDSLFWRMNCEIFSWLLSPGGARGGSGRSEMLAGILIFFAPCSSTSSTSAAFRKKVYHSTDELQVDLDAWIRDYEARPYQGRWCYGKTPTQTLLDAMRLTKEKMIAA
jgi:hypothetical protein